MSALRTLAVGTVFIAVIAAACGGGDSDAEETDATTAPAPTTAAPAAPETTEAAGSTEAPQPDEPAPDTTESGATESAVTESAASVTIDGVPYEFASNGPAATCNPDFFGGFLAVLYTPDLGGNFSVELWDDGSGDGAQVPAARMTVDAGGEILDLEADPDMSWPAAEAGTSYVADFSYEGSRAEGTIYFINNEVAFDASLAPLEAIVAEFEVVCADG